MTATALAAPRALTPPERAKLRAQLKAHMKIATGDDADDAEELLDYALEMVEGGKAAGHVAEELLFMEMPVCGEAEAAKVGETLVAFFAGLESDNKDKDDAELQEWLVRIREKKSERLASVQKGRKAASVRDRIAGLEEGKAKKDGGVAGVPKTKEGEQSPGAGLEKGKGKDDEGVLVGEKEKEGRDALPPASLMTVAELKEELRARNDSGYVPHSRLALEAALAAARRKDGTSDTKQVLDPGARLKGGADVDEENAGGEGKGKVAAATSLGSDRSVEGGASVADGRLAAGDIGDVEEGKGSAAVQAASSAGGQGAPAVSAAVHPNMRHHYRAASDAQAGSRVHPSAGSGAHGNDGKGLGVAILVLLLISFGLAFAKPPEPTCRQVGNTFSRYEICTQTAFIAPYIAGACNIIALILTSSLTCHCCCAAGIELEDRAKKFITAALLAIVTMFVLGVVGAFVLSSNGTTITSGVLALGIISLVLNVAAIIFVGLFTWSSERCGRNWRDCRSFVRSNRRTVILTGVALAIVVAAAVTAAILVPQSKTGSSGDDGETASNSVHGYEYVGVGYCSDRESVQTSPRGVNEAIYPSIKSMEPGSEEACGRYCDQFLRVQEFRGFFFEPRKHCYSCDEFLVSVCSCHFDRGTNFEGISSMHDKDFSVDDLPSRTDELGLGDIVGVADGYSGGRCYKVARGHRTGETYDVCNNDSECNSGTCAFIQLPYDKSGIQRCCPSDDVQLGSSRFCTGAPYGSTCSDDQQCASDLCLPQEQDTLFSKKQCWTRGGNKVGEYCFVYDEVCASNVCRNERCAESKIADYQRCEIDNDCESGACALAKPKHTMSAYYKKVCCASGLIERSVGDVKWSDKGKLVQTAAAYCVGVPKDYICGPDVDNQCASGFCLHNGHNYQCWDGGGLALGGTCGRPGWVNHDELCESNVCFRGKCAESRIDDYEECRFDNDCKSGACGRIKRPDSLIYSTGFDMKCCGSGRKDFGVGVKKFCVGLPAGFPCCGRNDDCCLNSDRNSCHVPLVQNVEEMKVKLCQ